MSEQTGTAEATTNEGVQETQTVDELPQWAREKLTKANNEAAKYRNEKNAAVEAAKAAVQADFEAKLAEAVSAKESIESELSDAKLSLAKLTAVLKVGFPSDKAEEYAARVQGTTPEEIAADVAKLRELFGGNNAPSRTPAVDRSPDGGDDAMALNGDPLLQSLKSALGIN